MCLGGVERFEDVLGHLRGDARAVVAHRQRAIGVQFDFDAVGVARDGFVHRVVDDFGGKVVVGAFVDAANIHAGA